MGTPDWNELAKLDVPDYCYFRSERFDRYIKEMWREIVQNKDRDNNEIKSIWIHSIQDNHFAKSDFMGFIITSREEDEYRPIDWQDTLRYFRKKQVEEEFEMDKMKSFCYKTHE
jgi:hypothetical protein